MNPSDPPQHRHSAEEMWRTYMTTGQMPDDTGSPWYMRRFMRPIARLLPNEPRCYLCDYPFEGLGGLLVRTFTGLAPSRMNPRLCNVCEHAAKAFPGGAEVEMSLVFADVRGSTSIAENLSPVEFSRLIDRFYQAASKVIYKKYGLLEKLIGDEVAGFLVPGIAGPEHARLAIEAGEGILRATGHADARGPWVPVGVGVHTGAAFVGSVGDGESAPTVTVLGDTVNATARLASQAAAGEVLISDATRSAAGLAQDGLEGRRLSLKGRKEPLDVWVKRVSAS